MRCEGLVIYYAGEGRPNPNAVFLYQQISGIEAIRSVIGDTLFQTMPREMVSVSELSGICKLILKLGSLEKKEVQSLLVVIVEGDGTTTMRYLDLESSKVTLLEVVGKHGEDNPLNAILMNLKSGRPLNH
jgi:hypothetical protein